MKVDIAPSSRHCIPMCAEIAAIRSATSDRIRSHLDDRMSRSDGRAVDGIVHLARELLAKTGPSMNCPYWSQLSRVTTGQAARRRREWRDRSRRLRRRPPKHVLERDAEVSERDISRWCRGWHELLQYLDALEEEAKLRRGTGVLRIGRHALKLDPYGAGTGCVSGGWSEPVASSATVAPLRNASSASSCLLLLALSGLVSALGRVLWRSRGLLDTQDGPFSARLPDGKRA